VRILHLSKFYPPDPGGLERVVRTLAEGAADRGHEVRVVCATGSGWRRDPGKRTTEPPARGVAVARLPTTGVFWSQPIARGYVAAAKWPADVVYVHHPHPLADFAVLRSPRRPTIVLHHSDVQRQKVASLLYRPLARAVARRASVTVVAARANVHHAEDLGVEGRAKARVIPFGVDHQFFSPAERPPRPLDFPPRDGPIGLFVGRFTAYKGLDVLLRAIEGTRLRMVLVGGGGLNMEVRRLIDERGLGAQVTPVGEVSDGELPVYYQNADYFVLPSTSPAEMFGLAMVEAMACGKPVICTQLGTGVNEVNVPDETGLVVPPGDAEALRHAMERLAADQSFRRQLGAAGRKRVEAHYTVERMVSAHLQLCNEIGKTH
jgi:glycosyltransferase involved in cell wall biosynthesis